MKVFLQQATIALCLIGFSSSAAGAETRRLQFEIEPIIILNCVEQIDYTINTTQLLAAEDNRTKTLSAIGSRATSAKLIEASFAADAVLNESGASTVDLVIEDACSVRGLGKGEGFLVNVNAADQGLLVNPGADGVLAIRGARAKPDYGNRFARQFSIPQSRISLDRAIKLDVQLRVDLRYANGSGRYSSPVDGVFSIEVSSP